MQRDQTTSEQAEPGSISPANREKLERLKNGWADLLLQATERGFYGNVAVELVVQDGTIQYIRQRVERIER